MTSTREHHAHSANPDPIALIVAEQTWQEEQPEAVILYGSRARGDHRPDSDVDLLLITHAPVSEEGRKALNSRAESSIKCHHSGHADTPAYAQVVPVTPSHIYIRRSRAQPEAPTPLSTAYFPGTDSIWHEEDVQFNYCTDSAFITPSEPMAADKPGNVYATLIHEMGHALGLHHGNTQHPQKPQSRNHPNSNIFQSLMRHKTINGQNCSPHPLDIMALYAIYQTVE